MNSKTERGLFLGLSILLVIFVAIFVSRKHFSKEGTDITIGAILPMTGNLASYAEPLKRGMDLAVHCINQQGGIDGKNLRIVYEDDRGEAPTAVSAYRKLVDMDYVPMVIGGMFSASTFAIAPLAEQEHIVILSPTASAIELTDAGDYIFRIYPSDIYDGAFLARFAWDTLGAKKVAIVYEQVASVVAIADRFKSDFEAAGGEVAVYDGYRSDLNDFNSLVKKVKDAKPDVLFFPGNLTPMANLLVQAKRMALNTKLLTISTFFDAKILELTQNASEGVMFSTPMFDPSDSSPEMVEFVKVYMEMYGIEPDILGGYGYDVVRIAAEALGKGMTPDQIKNALYAIEDFPGVTGRTTFDENGDVTKDLKMMAVKNGTFQPFEE